MRSKIEFSQASSNATNCSVEQTDNLGVSNDLQATILVCLTENFCRSFFHNEGEATNPYQIEKQRKEYTYGNVDNHLVSDNKTEIQDEFNKTRLMQMNHLMRSNKAMSEETFFTNATIRPGVDSVHASFPCLGLKSISPFIKRHLSKRDEWKWHLGKVERVKVDG